MSLRAVPELRKEQAGMPPVHLLLGETGNAGSEREGDKKRRRWEKSGKIIYRFEGVKQVTPVRKFNSIL